MWLLETVFWSLTVFASSSTVGSAEARLKQILAGDPFMPYERFVSLAGTEVAAEIHAELMREIVVPVDLKEVAGLDESQYVRRGPYLVLRSDVIESSIISEIGAGATSHRSEASNRVALTLPNGWNEASKVDAFSLFTAEIFFLHALSQDLLATDENIVELAQAAGFALTEPEVRTVRDVNLAATVLHTDTVRAIESLFHRGIHSSSHPAFIRELSFDKRDPGQVEKLSAWFRLVIAPALRTGLKSVMSPNETHVFMPDSAMKEFFALQLQSLIARMTARPVLSDGVRKGGLVSLLSKMAETLPRQSDLAIMKHLEALGLSFTALEIFEMIERFEEITVLPAAIVAFLHGSRRRITGLDVSKLTALAPPESRLRNPRVMRVTVSLWDRECVSLGFCIDHGTFWRLSPEGAQRAFMSMIPTADDRDSSNPSKRSKRD